MGVNLVTKLTPTAQCAFETVMVAIKAPGGCVKCRKKRHFILNKHGDKLKSNDFC